MPKLFDMLDAAQQQTVKTPEQLARDQWYAIAAKIRSEIRDGVSTIASDCQRLGMNQVLATMPDEVAKQFATLLPMIQTLWESATDALKFPEMPGDAPVGEGE